MTKTIIITAVVVAVLAFIWLRYRKSLARLHEELEPGRGIADEAATAFRDVARQVIRDRSSK